MNEGSILLIGQVLVDAFVPSTNEYSYLRLGGIMHAARALGAVGCKFAILYVAPDYLDDDIQGYGQKIGASLITKIGTVKGAPNLMLIGEPREYGPQRYDFILRNNHKIELYLDRFSEALEHLSWTDALVFPGGFPLEAMLQLISRRNIKIYIDVNFEPEDWEVFNQLDKPIETLIISTSSALFRKEQFKSADELVSYAEKNNIKTLLLKENRGGARFFDLQDRKSPLTIPAQTKSIAHSVGVGDCYNAVFSSLRYKCSEDLALRYASCIAAEYASTLEDEPFINAAKSWLDIPPDEVLNLGGISLPWEERPTKQIYIAAPDFDYVDSAPIDEIVRSLKYHNFSPRRPVKEHGQITSDSTKKQKRATFSADMKLLDECSLLLAVIICDDPGTLIEIGIAYEKGMPVIVYDPYKKANNIFLTELPDLLSSDLDEIVMTVFDLLSRKK